MNLLKTNSRESIVILILFTLIVIVAGIFLLKSKFLPTKAIHFHAGFQVYKDNKLVDFSDIQYMHTKPCTLNGKPVNETEDNQEEKAHLHNNIGDVVHVHRDGATWGDLFINIRYPINYKNSLAYINGVKVINFQTLLIKPYDSLQVFIGNNDIDKFLHMEVKKDHIVNVEKQSEDCGI